MTNELMDMLRGSPLIKKAIELFIDMISGDEHLYNEAWRVISTEENIERIPQSFYDKSITRRKRYAGSCLNTSL